MKEAPPRVRPFHCTLDLLTPVITPNGGNSTAQFLVVGDCVCADSCSPIEKCVPMGPFYMSHILQLKGKSTQSDVCRTIMKHVKFIFGPFWKDQFLDKVACF